MNAPKTDFHTISIDNITIDRFIDLMLSVGGDPRTCTGLLAAAYLYIHDNASAPGISLDTSLESFSTTIRTLDANRKLCS